VLLLENRKTHFDSMGKVSLHPVSAAAVELRLTVLEVVNSGMFKEPSNH
jgi:hypothetical protein